MIVNKADVFNMLTALGQNRIINDKELLAFYDGMLFKQFGQKFINETAPPKGALFKPLEGIFATG